MHNLFRLYLRIEIRCLSKTQIRKWGNMPKPEKEHFRRHDDRSAMTGPNTVDRLDSFTASHRRLKHWTFFLLLIVFLIPTMVLSAYFVQKSCSIMKENIDRQFAALVETRKGTIDFFMQKAIHPEALQELLQPKHQDENLRTFLLNAEGQYQAGDASSAELLRAAGYTPSREMGTQVASMRLGEEPVLVAHAWLETLPWCVVMIGNEDAALKEMRALRHVMIAGLILLTAVIMGFVWLVVHRLFNKFRALDKEMLELKGQLYHAHKMVSVGQLAGEVAHEINNPLAIIDSEAGVIRDMLDPQLGLDASPEAICQELDEINKAVKRAKGITRKLLSFVRKTEMKLVESDINLLLDDMISGMKEQEIRVSGIQLVKDYDHDLPKIFTEPDLIQQVFLNLVNNAGDAVEKGDTITLKTGTRGDCIIITISDTGKGMTPDQLEKVFMPFFTTKEVGKGTGLGLPICINIIESLGGRLEVQSKPGAGSSFTVVLPISGKSLDDNGKTVASKA